MPAPSEIKLHRRVPGRVTPDYDEHIQTDCDGRTLQTQWDPSPDWGRNMENRLNSKRHSNPVGKLFK